MQTPESVTTLNWVPLLDYRGWRSRNVWFMSDISCRGRGGVCHVCGICQIQNFHAHLSLRIMNILYKCCFSSSSIDRGFNGNLLRMWCTCLFHSMPLSYFTTYCRSVDLNVVSALFPPIWNCHKNHILTKTVQAVGFVVDCADGAAASIVPVSQILPPQCLVP